MTCVERILSNEYYDFVVDYILPEDVWGELPSDRCFIGIDDEFGVAYVSSKQLPSFSFAAYPYSFIPKLYGLMAFNEQNLSASGIQSVQRPPLSLTGEGIIIGFVDTGIRYQDSLFINENNESRIISIWDQTIQSGTRPSGYEYGSEFSREQLNLALRSENPELIVPTKDEIGHGTALASAAAGNRVDGVNFFSGAAPKVDIAVVKLKPAKQNLRDLFFVDGTTPAYSETDIMLGIKYLDSLAVTFQRPIVICFGLGSNQGNHSGDNALSVYLNRIAAKRSRAVVVCGGNEGAASHHFEGSMLTLSEGQVVTKDQEETEIRVSRGVKGFTLELWGRAPDTFTVSIFSPGGERIDFIPIRKSGGEEYTFVFEKTRIRIDIILVEEQSGEELIFMRFEEPTEGIWTVYTKAIGNVWNGTYNMWLPISEFLSAPVIFLRPNPYTTITVPGLAQAVITTAAYDARSGGIATFSGRGYSSDNIVKPDFASPGVNVTTSMGDMSGSSFSAALTAGAVALFMQWAILEKNAYFVESAEIKNYFIRGAVRDYKQYYPNRNFGWGTMDVYGALASLRL